MRIAETATTQARELESRATFDELRERTFKDVVDSLGCSVRFSNASVALAHGDSLELLHNVPSQSVSLILTDPPYHCTQKRNIYGDTTFKQDKHYLDWLSRYAKEWKRILKPNGTLYCFCATEMSARIEVAFSHDFNILSHVVWTKPNEPGFDGWKGKMKKSALRQWYAHSERIIVAEPAREGNLHRSPLAALLKTARLKAGLSTYDLAEIIGAYGKVNHGGAVSNWEAGRNVPSREQYQKLCDALLHTEKVSALPIYEDAIRPFQVNGDVEFTYVWNFPSVRPYKGKHPAEKPLIMLEHIISASTFQGDIVLDCFAGSGSTAAAAFNLGRRSVSMEIEDQWCEQSCHRFNNMHQLVTSHFHKPTGYGNCQDSLFNGGI